MGYTEDVQRTIDYIEDNLKKPMTLEDCARVSGYSKFHFHRVFSIHLGLTMMEYIRKRRLSHAMLDVINGRRILDIALDYGYSSERAFSRAFLQEFGQIPSRCREAVYAVPPIPVLADTLNQRIGGVQMNYLSEVTISTLPAFTVASAVRVSDEPEDDVITYLTEWSERTGIGAGTRRFGFDAAISEEQQQEGLRGYEYWVELKETAVVLPEDVVLKQVEGCKYAMLRITEPFVDPFERIPRGWQQLAAWVNSRGYHTGCGKERYWLEEKLELQDAVVMDLYFPIE